MCYLLVTDPEIYSTTIIFVTLWWSKTGDIFLINQSGSNYEVPGEELMMDAQLSPP
jgi:hypothetical protein